MKTVNLKFWKLKKTNSRSTCYEAEIIGLLL